MDRDNHVFDYELGVGAGDYKLSDYVDDNLSSDSSSDEEDGEIDFEKSKPVSLDELTKFKVSRARASVEMVDMTGDDYVTDTTSSDQQGCLVRGSVRLSQHQKRVVNIMEQQRGLLVIHGTGSGKTFTAITAAECYLDADPERKVLVCAPTSVVPQFERELLAKFPETTRARLARYSLKTHQWLVSESKNNEHSKLTRRYRKTLLILDEAHNFRTTKTGWDGLKKVNKASGDSALVLGIALLFDKVMALTATPVVNTPVDVQNMIAMVSGSKMEFGWRKTGDLTKDELERFSGYVDVYDPPPVDPQYPKFSVQPVNLRVDKDEYEKYRSTESDLLKSETETGEEVARAGDTFYTKLRQQLNQFDTKINWAVKKIVSNVENGPVLKTVVFSEFKNNGIFEIAERLNAMEVKTAIVTGDTTAKKRDKAVSLYNKDLVKVLLITKAGAEGLDLKGTRQIIIMEPTWNPSTEAQIIGRGVRKGSHTHLPENERNVSVYRLIAYGRDPYTNKRVQMADGRINEISEGKRESIGRFLREMREAAETYRVVL